MLKMQSVYLAVRMNLAFNNIWISSFIFDLILGENPLGAYFTGKKFSFIGSWCSTNIQLSPDISSYSYVKQSLYCLRTLTKSFLKFWVINLLMQVGRYLLSSPRLISSSESCTLTLFILFFSSKRLLKT